MNVAFRDVDLPGETFFVSLVQLPAKLPRSIGSVAVRVRDDVAVFNVRRQDDVMANRELKVR